MEIRPESMQEIAVLVTGAGGDVCHGVCKSLLGSSNNYRLVVCGTEENNIYRYDSRVTFELTPAVGNVESYIGSLASLCAKHCIDVLIPTIDSELVQISHRRNLIAGEGVRLICCGSHSSHQICDDKYMTWLHCKHSDLPFIDTWLFDDWVKLDTTKDSDRFIVKPRVGNGSKGLQLKTSAELRGSGGEPGTIIQPYVEGNEYTAGVLTDHVAGSFVTVILRRCLVNGRTMFAERIIDTDIANQLTRIAETLDIPHLNIQFFVGDNGLIRPFELNGRFSGTSGTYHTVTNMADMYIMNRLCNNSLECLDAGGMKMFKIIRYMEDILI